MISLDSVNEVTKGCWLWLDFMSSQPPSLDDIIYVRAFVMAFFRKHLRKSLKSLNSDEPITHQRLSHADHGGGIQPATEISPDHAYTSHPAAHRFAKNLIKMFSVLTVRVISDL